MKPKKKSSVGPKKGAKKILPTKPLVLIDKTVATTKERTHNTIEDPVQIKDHKAPPGSARNHRPRLSCLEKLEQCNMSPFSSPGGSSFSPRLRKTLSPSFKMDREKRKLKPKNTLPQEKYPERKKTEVDKRDHKVKPKMTNEECNFAYQNLLLKKLKEKKITEESHESEASAPKFKKLNLNIHIPKQAKDCPANKIKEQRIKQLKKKIYEKYQKELPSFQNQQMKFFCSIVLIQRLFRQRRIKKFISQFISPRSNPQCNITGGFSREQNTCRLDLSATTEQQTSELIKKYHNLSFDKKKYGYEPEIRSTEINSTQKKVNLKDLELSAELSSHNEKKMINLVECLRDINFFKTSKNKGKMKSRVNVFNLQESFSEKCLMQSFYERVFKSSPSKMNNFQLFKSKQEEKHLERSIELINALSPEKSEVIVIDERCETQLQSKDHIEAKPLLIERVDMSVQTENFESSHLNNEEVISIKQLYNLSEGVILMLLNEFSEQFHAFTSRSILKKKKKSNLPGLKATDNSIREYLSGLSEFMMDNYQIEVIRRFSMINPMSFLKIHHQYDDDDEYQEEQEDEMNLPIVPNTLFYEYQQIYEAEKFTVSESEQKFSNFLEGLIKIHNLLLANCLSELLEKARIDRIILPWDDKIDFRRNKPKIYSKKNMKNLLESISNKICSSAFMRVGQFHQRLQDSIQEEKLLRSISMEYKSQGNDWSAQYQYLQLRMDLTKAVEEMILEEVMNDLAVFI